MPDLVIGRRDSSDDDWHWYPVPVGDGSRGDGPRRSRSGLLLAAIGALLAGIGVVLLVISINNDSSSGSQASPTALPASAAPTTSGARPTPAASASSPAVALSPAAPGDVRLFVWSRQQKQWLGSDLVKEEPGYREGDVVPFILRVEHGVASTLYEVQLKYTCRTSDGAAFDYLSNPSDQDNISQMTSPGPGRREDASIPIPDDSAIAFDGTGRRLRAWGASFQQAPEGPSPDGACQTDKQFKLRLMTQGETMFITWGGHLASSGDWGQNQGASSQRSPIYIEVTVGQSSPQKLGIGPDAITP